MKVVGEIVVGEIVVGEIVVGETALLPVKVLNHGWADNSVRVEFDEGPEGKTTMHLNRYTIVHLFNEPRDTRAPIEPDDIVFVAFEDGKWRVADMYQDQVFLTPHYDDYEPKIRSAMVADTADCYHVSPKQGR